MSGAYAESIGLVGITAVKDTIIFYLRIGVDVDNNYFYIILRFWEIGIRGYGDPFFLSPSPSIPSTPPPPLRGA